MPIPLSKLNSLLRALERFGVDDDDGGGGGNDSVSSLSFTKFEFVAEGFQNH